ncbi:MULTISPECIES: PLD nuclease N-terminal domain-containing protein [unclassified Clostridioides]|uniref:PLD nuclease N-terminal domain-containing protein n=1 Tax=unclassified Clostridioides TaxID=2635829 RepID=UPI001D0C565C|nr:PLDc_N domain-containing protein [Clostridioides sp. ES-S-0001-02]MCC0641059.1 PLDc_N domain-containing protein [Clostridioides sp. ES-S-0049-03]MCC0654098.1 PLDc_N domain-containing protein [Clostridioides sp. ES-S-0001-03]MCC0658007.1 PLDc_N domain-containing protein [Clostridioides sp. ES-S-0123-01]MCC0674275.1 PLDc_N domain-containing protein [Clostridioides sp. ES-S-0145-01]MCC0677264.1 PLDc_N domain-containing protein [Clostridioides sp. ES-W-0018-02]MCC0681616.1 PLDc_N domain-contai
MENLMEYLPLLLPVIILNLILVITALIHIIKHPNYKIGNKAIWIILVLFISIIGPILYFTIGRGDE